MSLKLEADEINSFMLNKLNEIDDTIAKAKQRYNQAIETYKTVDKGDRSENATFEAAVKEIKDSQLEIINREKEQQRLSIVREASKYNSVGKILLYTTFKVKVTSNTGGSLDNKELVFRIYPDGISYPMDRIIAANSRLAIAAFNHRVGDKIKVTNNSTGTDVEYTILDIY